jgi:MurNAc alpha-1-phosphate uridylyltransferase|tara:strand:- start:36895 stop:37557 length:663 start_codon:yes stop_codon:yes gene_type:complete
MKAMILAAGRGSRLRPLTDRIAKPLVRLGGKRLIEYHLERLAKSGFKTVIINIAYKGEQLREQLGNGSRYGLHIQYSDEGNEVLETGGGIANALPLLGEDTILVISADVFSDIPFDPNFNLGKKDAHFFVVENPAHHLDGDFTAAELALSGDQRYTYAGIGYYRPEIFKQRARVFAMSLCMHEAIARQGISSTLHSGIWFDIGTATRLHEAHHAILDKSL